MSAALLRFFSAALFLAVSVGAGDSAAQSRPEPRSASFTVAQRQPPATLEAEGGVPEPDDYRTNDYRTPVPRTLKGARVVHVDEVEKLWRDKSAVLVDVFPRAPKPPNLPAGTVWRDPSHQSIEGAHWLPNVGYGVLTPEIEDYFKSRLSALTNGGKKPVVFLCLRDCWMSWNAAKRALSWGYESVLWFPDGTDAWQENGFDLVRVEPVP